MAHCESWRTQWTAASLRSIFTSLLIFKWSASRDWWVAIFDKKRVNILPGVEPPVQDLPVGTWLAVSLCCWDWSATHPPSVLTPAAVIFDQGCLTEGPPVCMCVYTCVLSVCTAAPALWLGLLQILQQQLSPCGHRRKYISLQQLSTVKVLLLK